jgi:hypothetical protein
VTTAPDSLSPALPEDLADLERHLQDNLRAAEALARDLNEAQFQWQPDPTSWSIALCVDHLAVANRVYLEPMREAIATARQRGSQRRGPIRPGAFSRFFLSTLEPPPRRKMTAPRKIVPTLGKSKDVVMRDFLGLQVEVLALLREAADLDLNRIRFVNPFIPLLRFTVGTGFLVIAAHERRHLWQAERIRERAGFPER